MSKSLKFQMGDRVSHHFQGVGTVVRTESDESWPETVGVRFDNFKTYHDTKETHASYDDYHNMNNEDLELVSRFEDEVRNAISSIKEAANG